MINPDDSSVFAPNHSTHYSCSSHPPYQVPRSAIDELEAFISEPRRSVLPSERLSHSFPYPRLDASPLQKIRGGVERLTHQANFAESAFYALLHAQSLKGQDDEPSKMDLLMDRVESLAQDLKSISQDVTNSKVEALQNVNTLKTVLMDVLTSHDAKLGESEKGIGTLREEFRREIHDAMLAVRAAVREEIQDAASGHLNEASEAQERLAQCTLELSEVKRMLASSRQEHFESEKANRQLNSKVEALEDNMIHAAMVLSVATQGNHRDSLMPSGPVTVNDLKQQACEMAQKANKLFDGIRGARESAPSLLPQKGLTTGGEWERAHDNLKVLREIAAENYAEADGLRRELQLTQIAVRDMLNGRFTPEEWRSSSFPECHGGDSVGFSSDLIALGVRLSQAQGEEHRPALDDLDITGPGGEIYTITGVDTTFQYITTSLSSAIPSSAEQNPDPDEKTHEDLAEEAHRGPVEAAAVADSFAYHTAAPFVFDSGPDDTHFISSQEEVIGALDAAETVCAPDTTETPVLGKKCPTCGSSVSTTTVPPPPHWSSTLATIPLVDVGSGIALKTRKEGGKKKKPTKKDSNRIFYKQGELISSIMFVNGKWEGTNAAGERGSITPTHIQLQS